jgi:hypothetical protein
MLIKDYNRNSLDERNQPSTYVSPPSTLGNKPSYSLMTSQQRDERLDILLKKEKEIQDEMDIADAEAKTNSEASEHNKNEIRKLDSKKNEMGIVARASSIFGFGHIPYINKKIGYLQSEQAKHELHDQELRNQIRAHVSEQEDNIRSKNDIKRMFLDSGRDSTDGNRLSTINANYFAICKFIETYVEGFTFKEQLALMHALANEVSIKYFGNKGYNKPIDALYENPINDKMLITTSNKMDIFKDVNVLKTFLEQARQAEQAKQREKIASSQRHKEIFANVLKSRPKFSLVNPDVYKASQKSNMSKRIVQKPSSGTKNPKKPGGTRRHRRTRKSKK